ncbi:hypothetical protein IWW57_003959 [Coemansia sp. S610]|nr:hypothetical protein IWW57_003959 [Coemansia sp. S610]
MPRGTHDTGGDPRAQLVLVPRPRQHWRAAPQNIHGSSVGVALGRIQKRIGHTSSLDMHVFGRNVSKDHSTCHFGTAPLNGDATQVLLARSREAQQPDDSSRAALENAQPHAEQRGVDLVELVKVGKDKHVVAQLRKHLLPHPPPHCHFSSPHRLGIAASIAHVLVLAEALAVVVDKVRVRHIDHPLRVHPVPAALLGVQLAKVPVASRRKIAAALLDFLHLPGLPALQPQPLSSHLAAHSPRRADDGIRDDIVAPASAQGARKAHKGHQHGRRPRSKNLIARALRVAIEVD